MMSHLIGLMLWDKSFPVLAVVTWVGCWYEYLIFLIKEWVSVYHSQLLLYFDISFSFCFVIAIGYLFRKKGARRFFQGVMKIVFKEGF